MTDTEKSGKAKLHKKAEEIFQTENQLKTQSKEVAELIHNLRVHQIELEIQNEELRKAQVKLEDSRRKYFELYNFVSDGYFTLNKNGLILEVNLAGASLLGVERLKLINTSFIKYIDPEYRNEFHLHCMRVMETAEKQTTEIKLLKNDKSSFYVSFGYFKCS